MTCADGCGRPATASSYRGLCTPCQGRRARVGGCLDHARSRVGCPECDFMVTQSRFVGRVNNQSPLSRTPEQAAAMAVKVAVLRQADEWTLARMCELRLRAELGPAIDVRPPASAGGRAA